MARFLAGLFLLLLLSYLTLAQNPPTSDPQALAFAGQSIASMTGGAATGLIQLQRG